MSTTASADAIRSTLLAILHEQRLSALFQPIAALHEGRIFGYEGLIRGPTDSDLHSPLALFQAAERCALLPELDRACRHTIIRAFATAGLPGKLFLNINPQCLIPPSYRPGETLALLQEYGLPAQRVVIELTETQPIACYEALLTAVRQYRSQGFRIALDDLGEGFSSLRRWSELKPEFVKIDKYFIQGLNSDAQKRQFVRSIQHIALNTGTQVIAEGIETSHELDEVRRIGISLGQGYLLGKPQPRPAGALGYHDLAKPRLASRSAMTAGSLLVQVPTVTPEVSNTIAAELFARYDELQGLPVIDGGRPVGLLKRQDLLNLFARPYGRELHGQRPCATLMDTTPLQVEHTLSLQELSLIVSSGEHRHLADGFILTDQGRYLGMGTGRDLMRAITELQITAARYANPLTGLPGNRPIQEHIQSLLDDAQSFVVIYADLDHFKPFNDLYGYASGDELLRMTGELLQQLAATEDDFIGHIGGDDFVLVLQSADWQERCQACLNDFAQLLRAVVQQEHWRAGGYISHDRNNQQVWHPLVSLSLGAVTIQGGLFHSHLEVASAASSAKSMAKREQGSSLFIERRQHTDCRTAASLVQAPIAA
ncbi:GGDEF domain-containing protein [Chitinilyticum piscinae]|uniref:GGDEF domain-containing protein n=1 Tax=Chitinilyticum piscinae TaxID=2866724 RepID=A0A8J7K197_9NEIS|nr:GGDEF domain-containing protein [Chitinilyticum piscinae]MBE9608921.1 GGDEF domain-containing protein [Chitinilyticum piscinae]